MHSQRALPSLRSMPQRTSGYADHVIMLNRWDEAIREFERARERDPLSIVILFSLAGAYVVAIDWSRQNRYTTSARTVSREPSTLFYLFGTSWWRSAGEGSVGLPPLSDRNRRG